MQDLKMRAIVSTRYGSPDVLQLEYRDIPEPKDDEVLVRVHATSVTSAHTSMRTGKPLIGRLFLGIRKPKIEVSGTDFAGVVVAIGQNVEKYKVGDAVYGATDIDGGAYADYLTIRENGVMRHKPGNISFTEAAAVLEGAMTSLPFLRDLGQLKPGQKVLVNGASGSVGSAAVQLAKELGANVTGVSSGRNTEMILALGADETIDYTREDFTQRHGEYDVIFDAVGKSSWSRSKRALKPGGRYLTPVLRLSVLVGMVFTTLAARIKGSGKQVMFSATGLAKHEVKQANLSFVHDLLSNGVLKAVIDKTYRLEEIAEAHRYVDTGHKSGNVVVETVPGTH